MLFKCEFLKSEYFCVQIDRKLDCHAWNSCPEALQILPQSELTSWKALLLNSLCCITSRPQSIDFKEDRKGLECHLGQNPCLYLLIIFQVTLGHA